MDHQSTAYLCVRSYTDAVSQEAINVLEEAGFIVDAVPVEGLGLPEMTIDTHSRVYYGIQEIQDCIEHFKMKRSQNEADK